MSKLTKYCQFSAPKIPIFKNEAPPSLVPPYTLNIGLYRGGMYFFNAIMSVYCLYNVVYFFVQTPLARVYVKINHHPHSFRFSFRSNNLYIAI